MVDPASKSWQQSWTQSLVQRPCQLPAASGRQPAASGQGHRVREWEVLTVAALSLDRWRGPSRPLCRCDTALSLPFHCPSTAPSLLYHCPSTAPSLLYHCPSTAPSLLYHCPSHAHFAVLSLPVRCLFTVFHHGSAAAAGRVFGRGAEPNLRRAGRPVRFQNVCLAALICCWLWRKLRWMCRRSQMGAAGGAG